MHSVCVNEIHSLKNCVYEQLIVSRDHNAMETYKMKRRRKDDIISLQHNLINEWVSECLCVTVQMYRSPNNKTSHTQTDTFELVHNTSHTHTHADTRITIQVNWCVHENNKINEKHTQEILLMAWLRRLFCELLLVWSEYEHFQTINSFFSFRLWHNVCDADNNSNVSIASLRLTWFSKWTSSRRVKSTNNRHTCACTCNEYVRPHL